MKPNSRLSLALHTLVHMADEPERIRTSADFAAHSGTNPVVVRRVLGSLRKAGLVMSEKGHSGGWRLAKAPHKITLADVYLALEEQLIASNAPRTTNQCSVESALQETMSSLLAEAETGLIERLSGISLTEVDK
ncbi:MAG: Rrf2 family transcriptional regulator [Pseudomonadota bacterium]